MRLVDRLIAIFSARRGEWLTREELLDALYGDREDGGPDAAEACLDQTLHRMRAAGVKIESRHTYRIPPRVGVLALASLGAGAVKLGAAVVRWGAT